MIIRCFYVVSLWLEQHLLVWGSESDVEVFDGIVFLFLVFLTSLSFGCFFRCLLVSFVGCMYVLVPIVESFLFVCISCVARFAVCL